MINKFTNKFHIGDKTKQVLVLTVISFILVGAQRISATTTWSDPTQDPPGGAILSPLTVGLSSSTVQVLKGKLSMDTLGVFGNGFVEGLLSVGTTSSPTSASTTLLVDGNVAANEYCDASGQNCFASDTVVNFLTDIDEGVSCPSTPNYTSMNSGVQTGYYFNQPVFGENGYIGASSLGSTLGATANENRWDIATVPSSCKSDSAVGCVIREKIYRRYTVPGWSGWYQDKLYAVRDVEYRQDTTPTGSSADQLWWSSVATAGTAKNGDTVSSNVIRPFSYLYLRDDANVVGGETDNDKLSAYDYTRGYGFEIYFCSEASI